VRTTGFGTLGGEASSATLTWASVVVTRNVQPPSMRPASLVGLASSGQSSTTYRRQVPLGSTPRKSDKEMLVDPGGAGGGK